MHFEGTKVTKVMIIANCAIFVLGMILFEWRGYRGPDNGLNIWGQFNIDQGLRGLQVWRLFTYQFLHANPSHLLFNMLALWLFGRIVERVVGAPGFVALYVVGGVVASLGHVLWGLATGDPTPALGASGSVMAVAVTFAVLFPSQRLYLFFMVPMPAWFAVLLYVGLDLAGLFDARSSIAHAAHLGGAVTGLFYGFIWGRPRLRRLLRRR
jgi:membrane associated rhomboid family serine protease